MSGKVGHSLLGGGLWVSVESVCGCLWVVCVGLWVLPEACGSMWVLYYGLFVEVRFVRGESVSIYYALSLGPYATPGQEPGQEHVYR